ncbi:hypothetical protein ACQPZF_39370 [Actinosynnema sp. CS-041913]|uniref:hypothetical protein n=1 Tax=Actinosynnema sp. CS-041913 TaxID=3239917 RepID=UPI003D94BD34
MRTRPAVSGIADETDHLPWRGRALPLPAVITAKVQVEAGGDGDEDAVMTAW